MSDEESSMERIGELVGERMKETFGTVKPEHYPKLIAKLERDNKRLKDKIVRLEKLNTELAESTKRLQKESNELRTESEGLKKENDQLRKQIRELETEVKNSRRALHTYNRLPELFNPRKAIFKWIDENGKTIVAPVAREIIEHIDEIDNYKIGLREDGKVVFEEGFYERKEGDFPVYDAHLKYIRQEIKGAIEKGELSIPTKEKKVVVRELKPLLEKRDQKVKSKEKVITPQMSRIWEALERSKGKHVTTVELRTQAGVSKQTAHTHLEYFRKLGIVDKSGSKREYEWRVKDTSD